MEKTKKIETIEEALCEFGGRVKSIERAKTGYNYKYAPIETILKAISPVLYECGLAVKHSVYKDDGEVWLKSTLVHRASKEVVETSMPLYFERGDPKKLGAAITYARRYNLQCLLNLAFNDGDVDDDQDTKKKSASRGATVGPIQLKTLTAKIDEDVEMLHHILTEFKVNALADLPFIKYKLALSRVNELQEEAHA